VAPPGGSRRTRRPRWCWSHLKHCAPASRRPLRRGASLPARVQPWRDCADANLARRRAFLGRRPFLDGRLLQRVVDLHLSAAPNFPDFLLGILCRGSPSPACPVGPPPR
jgi:hypothetical protein